MISVLGCSCRTPIDFSTAALAHQGAIEYIDICLTLKSGVPNLMFIIFIFFIYTLFTALVLYADIHDVIVFSLVKLLTSYSRSDIICKISTPTFDPPNQKYLYVRLRFL